MNNRPDRPDRPDRPVVTRVELNGQDTEIGAQAQSITRILHSDNTPTRSLSGGVINMTPGKVSLAHKHSESDLIVVVVQGEGATLFGDSMDPVVHGPESWVHIPAGVPHVGVNLSLTEPLIAYEFRSDPTFRDDVQVLPELQAVAEQRAAEIQH